MKSQVLTISLVMYWGLQLLCGQSTAYPPDMVFIESGSYIMGCSTPHTTCNSNEQPPHIVYLNDYFIGEYEVTQSLWEMVMDENPSLNQSCGDECPVELISWYSALVFCNKLSVLENLQPVYTILGQSDPDLWGPIPNDENDPTWDAVFLDPCSNGYRLPTEAEWEYAARGGKYDDGFLFSGSNNILDVGWFGINSGDSSNICGSLDSNQLGIYDMSGNVFEWCWDWYQFDYYEMSAQYLPQGPVMGLKRTLRGGSFNFLQWSPKSIWPVSIFSG